MKESSVRPAESMARMAPGLSLAWIVLLAFLVSGGLAVNAVAQEELPPVEIPKTGMKSGRLTAKHESSATISGQDYAFHSKIAFGDNESRPLEWKDFKKGDDVQYHLKQERIDLLIRVLPQ